MSLDPLLLRGANRAIEAAAIYEGMGDHERARRDIQLARQLLDGALREDDYEAALRNGSVIEERGALLERLTSDTEPTLSHDRDNREPES